MKPLVISGSTNVVGIVGGSSQVSRSLSPEIHNAAFRALEMDWVYLPFSVERHVTEAVRGLGAAGIRGFNVTMPHKVATAEAVDELEGAAKTTGAVNTVEVRRGRLIGHNTDGDGLVRFLVRDLGVSLSGASVLVIGTGGAARSVISALAQAGAQAITVMARERARAEALRGLAGSSEFRIAVFHEDDPVGESDVIVNATPVGQADEDPLIRTERIRPNATVVDLVYMPQATRLVTEARNRGATASGGLGMLLHQAVLSFEIWTGIEPPIEVMSASALAFLKRRLDGAD